MNTVTIKLPRVAVATSLASSLIEKHHKEFTNGNVILIVDGHDCEITTPFFVDYFTSLIIKYPGIIEVIQHHGPAELKGVGDFHSEISGIDFNIMVDTLKSNMEKNIESIGEYVSITYEVSDIETLAIILLKRGFKLDQG
jgi:hypothetical protein